MQHTDSPWLLICEDDVTWAENASQVLEHELRMWDQPKAGLLSLYCPKRMSKLLENTHSRGSALSRNWYGLTFGRKLWGAQAFLMQRKEAEALLTCGYMQHVLSDVTKTANIDAHVAESMLLRERQIFYRIPCLVDHVLGDLNSSIYGNKDRPELRTRYFEDVAR
jgi:GR25 family glycosyltransferase involved in LPS biosynthesis